MPIGLPNSSALNSRKVCAFSLDTSVIEAAGFRFNDGALKHLSGQLPPWLQLWMPDIVVREISQHRLDNVSRSVQSIQAGMQDLHRHMGGVFSQSDPDWLRTAKDTAIHAFNDQLHKFLQSHNGIVIEPSHARLSTEIFNMYFQNQPPFGGGKDKKHEFPDAAALVMLEFMAAEKGVQVIAVSKDSGWAAYAAQSAHIYCVSSIQDLTALFVSHTPVARAVKARLDEAFKNPDSNLKSAVKTAIEGGLISLPWRIHLPHSYRYEFDAGVIETKLRLFKVESDAIGVWITSSKNDACVAEMPVDIDVSLRVEIIVFQRDRFGEKIDVVDVETIIEQRFEIKLQMELEGALQTGEVADLLKNFSLSDSPVEVHISRDNLGPSWTGIGAVYSSWEKDFDGMNMDDIPF